MKEKILYFEGAGCEGTQVNDVPNCCIRTAFTADDGKQYYLELLSGCESYNNYDIPAELIGKAKKRRRGGYCSYYQIDKMIIVDFCFQIFDNGKRGDCNSFRHNIERKNTALSYTKANIIQLINNNLNCSFTDIVVLPWLAGYRVHGDNRKYNLMERYKNIPERTKERERIYHEVAKEYFTKIYNQHIKRNPSALYLMTKYETWSLVKMTDRTITIRSHTYKELIDDNQRVKTWRVKY